MDGMTWTVECIGIVILCVWIVVPVHEFASTFRHATGDRTAAVPGWVAEQREPGWRPR